MQATTPHHAWPTAPRMRGSLLCFASLSLAAHAVLLDAIDVAPRVKLRGDAGSASHVAVAQVKAPSAVMRIRMTTAPVASAVAKEAASVADMLAAAPSAAMRAPPESEPQQPSQAPLLASAVDVSAQPHEPSATDELNQAADADANDAAEAHRLAATSPQGAGTNDYIPRPELSVPPLPRTPVVLSAPSDADQPQARHVGVLALFIDETGRVHHIVPDEPRMPPSYEQAAREAFMTAAFTPGQLDGRAVKSRIRIEVVFDNTPLDGP